MGSRIMLTVVVLFVQWWTSSLFVFHHFYDELLVLLQDFKLALFGSRSLPSCYCTRSLVPCYWYPCLSFLLESEPWSFAWYLAWRIEKTLDAHWMEEEGVFSLWNLACGWNYDRWATVRLWRALITKLIFWVNENYPHFIIITFHPAVIRWNPFHLFFLL